MPVIRRAWKARLRAISDRHPDDRVFFAAIASVLVIAIGGALSILILGVWVVNSIEVGGQPALAETVHIFRPPPQPKPKPQPQPKPKPLDGLQQRRYLHFQDPRSTARFMANYLGRGPAFDDVFYGVTTPFEITLHGNLHGSRFDLRLYKLGRETVLLKNCMMGSCYSEWAGPLVGHEPAGSERFLLHQRVRAGVLRFGRRSVQSGPGAARLLRDPARG
jgi:hypothetical protein